MGGSRRGSEGFTLMETLVAVVIFTAMIVALQRGSVAGLRAIRLAGMDQQALALAREKLATASVDGVQTEAVDEGSGSGSGSALQWRVSIRKYKAPEAVVMPDALAVYWVGVNVAWRERAGSAPRLIELQTIKLAVAP